MTTLAQNFIGQVIFCFQVMKHTFSQYKIVEKSTPTNWSGSGAKKGVTKRLTKR